MPFFTKLTWLDRAVSTPNKYTKTLETSSTVTLVADPTVTTQAGTPVNATNMNRLEQAVQDTLILNIMGAL